ncbi:hypothetical protein GUITHDRAFT_139578 [Guillardia theta CCMP2712]|uniref:Uncharacterized protein n=2 Tax=Guillardia theta TaxID=55529 RepID=L1J8H1_GUITC|nr:hypothetical protein GUITHDRAFT_139578 [Guillardia theta CCMP2712]EKX44642.1 hypothetical protein GUITHDRAFT_139578 [Guillardia theta CCMP2712]|eukprot:XP_005831622.1 hypothetical protein GUITHDRAFT_139578 [Guillardia theta CCMP2712]
MFHRIPCDKYAFPLLFLLASSYSFEYLKHPEDVLVAVRPVGRLMEYGAYRNFSIELGIVGLSPRSNYTLSSRLVFQDLNTEMIWCERFACVGRWVLANQGDVQHVVEMMPLPSGSYRIELEIRDNHPDYENEEDAIMTMYNKVVFVVPVLTALRHAPGEAKTIVCIPVLPRRNGKRYVDQAIESVGASDVPVDLMMMLNEGEAKPEAAHHLVVRRDKEIKAPCLFLTWRRSLILDFIHMMEEALKVGNPTCFLPPFADICRWVSKQQSTSCGWRTTASCSPESRSRCMIALHECNCHSCEKIGVYNGVGMVAVLFFRSSLVGFIDFLRKEEGKGNFFVPLDEQALRYCKRSSSLPPASFYLPTAAIHMGDVALGTTKPDMRMKLNISYPRDGEVFNSSQIVGMGISVSGFVFDAEYAWLLRINDKFVHQRNFQVPAPVDHFDCTDNAVWADHVKRLNLLIGKNVVEVKIYELESHVNQQLIEASITVVVADPENSSGIDSTSPTRVHKRQMLHSMGIVHSSIVLVEVDQTGEEQSCAVGSIIPTLLSGNAEDGCEFRSEALRQLIRSNVVEGVNMLGQVAKLMEDLPSSAHVLFLDVQEEACHECCLLGCAAIKAQQGNRSHDLHQERSHEVYGGSGGCHGGGIWGSEYSLRFLQSPSRMDRRSIVGSRPCQAEGCSIQWR